MKYERIIKAISDECWAILPSKLEEIIGVIEARAAGVTLSAEQLEEFAARRQKPVKNGKVGVLPIRGTISHRAGTMQSSLGTSSEAIGQAFDSLMADSGVGGVVFDIDSPGGAVAGIPELASKIRSRRGEKPMVAVANSLAASAAFWLGTAADSLAVTPSGLVGSVGVLAAHMDHSAAMEKEGIKATFITSAKFKAEGNQTEPLSDEAVANAQERVNHFHSMFVKDLARNRDTTETRVERDFGEGRVITASEAVERNMADRVATLEQVIGEMAGKPTTRRRTAAARRLSLT